MGVPRWGDQLGKIAHIVQKPVCQIYGVRSLLFLTVSLPHCKKHLTGGFCAHTCIRSGGHAGRPSYMVAIKYQVLHLVWVLPLFWNCRLLSEGAFLYYWILLLFSLHCIQCHVASSGLFTLKEELFHVIVPAGEMVCSPHLEPYFKLWSQPPQGGSSSPKCLWPLQVSQGFVLCNSPFVEGKIHKMELKHLMMECISSTGSVCLKHILPIQLTSS